MSESNGTLNSIDEQIDTLRKELKVKQLTFAKEACDYTFGDWLAGRDRIPRQGQDPPSRPSDRARGNDWPRLRTITDLDVLRSTSRQIAEENGYARGALAAIIDATVGAGGAFTSADDDVTALLSDWSNAEWAGVGDPDGDGPLRESKERQFLRRLLRDGEALIRTTDGLTHFNDPERLRGGDDAAAGWSWGIQTVPGNTSIVRAYRFEMDMGEVDVVPASDIVHCLIEGTDSTVKRGIPFFSFDVADAFLDAAKLMSAISLGARVRAKIALLWKVVQGEKADIETMTGALLAQTAKGSGRDRDPVRPDGTEVFSPDTLEPTALPADNSPAQLEALAGSLRMGGTAAQLPEYAVSGDASNANYASTRESGTPFIRRAQGVQSLVRGTALRLGARRLKLAIEQGELSEEQVRKVRMNYELPDVVTVDFPDQVATMTDAVDKGILTVGEARVALGYSAKPGDVA